MLLFFSSIKFWTLDNVRQTALDNVRQAFVFITIVVMVMVILLLWMKRSKDFY